MALDPQSGGHEAVDRITVKIADLGNGERSFFFPYGIHLCVLTAFAPSFKQLG
jgi:hypothetical protein